MSSVTDRLAWLRAGCGVLAVIWLAAAPVRAADVELEQNALTIDGLQILPAEHFDPKKLPDQFYYLPPSVRLTEDLQGKPSIFLVKYNLPQDVGYAVADVDGQKVFAKQGGYLALEASFSLSETALLIAEKKLREKVKNPNARLSLLPLDKATIALEYIDPDAKPAKVTIGPEAAPLNGSTVSWLIPLSKGATDIMASVLSTPKGGRTVNIKVTFEYSGYTSPLAVAVSVNWRNVYKHTSWNVCASGGFFFFSANADLQKVFEEMVRDGTVTFRWKDGRPHGQQDKKDVEKLIDMLTPKVVEAMFDASIFSKEEAAKAQKPSGGWFGLHLGVGFAWKSVERISRGSFTFNYDRKEKTTRVDARFSDFTNLKFDATHVHEVEAGDWSLIAPRVFLNADLSRYSKVLVTVRYGEKTPPVTVSFSEKTGLVNQVPREWQCDTSRPKGERFTIEYKVEAQLKDGAFTAAQMPKQSFETAWIKSDKSFLQLSPEAWQGPRKVRHRVRVTDDWAAKKATGATVKLSWDVGGKEPYERLVELSPVAPEALFEDLLATAGPVTATITWRAADGKVHSDVPVTKSVADITAEAISIHTLPTSR